MHEPYRMLGPDEAELYGDTFYFNQLRFSDPGRSIGACEVVFGLWKHEGGKNRDLIGEITFTIDVYLPEGEVHFHMNDLLMPTRF